MKIIILVKRSAGVSSKIERPLEYSVVLLEDKS